MSGNRRNGRGGLPARGWRVPAYLCALLLTGALLVTGVSLLGIQALGSTALYERAALNAGAVDRQIARIDEEIGEAAAEFGFDPEPVRALIDRAQIEAFDREVVRWWTDFTAGGRLGERPSFSPEGIRDVLEEDADFMESLDETRMESTLEKIETRAETIVFGSAVRFRNLIVETAVRLAGRRVDLPQIMELLRKIPILGGLAGLLLAGLIALMMSRRIQTAGQYIGGALAAAGLLGLIGLILVKLLNIRGMIAEASPALEAQYAVFSRILTLETAGAALVLILIGALLMIRAGKEVRTDGK